MTKSDSEQTAAGPVEMDRRAAMRALAKYAGATGAVAVILTADQALADSTRPCSRVNNPNPGRNCRL